MTITTKMIQDKLDTVNSLLGRPLQPYTFKDGASVANVGVYHLSESFQAQGVDVISNESGGTYTVLESTTKREVFAFLSGLVYGIHLAKK